MRPGNADEVDIRRPLEQDVRREGLVVRVPDAELPSAVRSNAVDSFVVRDEEGGVGGRPGPEHGRDAIIQLDLHDVLVLVRPVAELAAIVQVDRGDVLVLVRPVAELDEVVPSYSTKEDSRMASNETATRSSMLSARGVSMSSPRVSVHSWPYPLLPVK